MPISSSTLLSRAISPLRFQVAVPGADLVRLALHVLDGRVQLGDVLRSAWRRCCPTAPCRAASPASLAAARAGSSSLPSARRAASRRPPRTLRLCGPARRTSVGLRSSLVLSWMLLTSSFSAVQPVELRLGDRVGLQLRLHLRSSIVDLPRSPARGCSMAFSSAWAFDQLQAELAALLLGVVEVLQQRLLLPRQDVAVVAPTAARCFSSVLLEVLALAVERCCGLGVDLFHLGQTRRLGGLFSA